MRAAKVERELGKSVAMNSSIGEGFFFLEACSEIAFQQWCTQCWIFSKCTERCTSHR